MTNATADEWFNDPKWLRKLLSTPVRVNKIRDAKERERIIQRETMRREKALFALYHIPNDWPVDVRWEWLARNLAGELFAGCKTIEKGKGGPSIYRRNKRHELRMALFRKFEKYLVEHKYLSRLRAAEYFVGDNKKACAQAGLKDPKSFAQAMKKLGIGTRA